MKVILGTMTWGRSSQTSKIQALKQIKCVMGHLKPDEKILLDTASMYQVGETEQVIGEILEENPDIRERIEVHTKANPMFAEGGISKQGVRSQLESSLKALKMDKVDLYYIHMPDINTPIEETFSICNDLYKEGKFQALGISNYAAWDVIRIHNLCRERGWILPSVYQGCYNALNRTVEAELLPAVRALGMSFYAYNPLAAGLLTGRYFSTDEIVNSTSGRFSKEFDFIPTNSEDQKLEKFKGLGNKAYLARYAKESTMKAIRMIEEERKNVQEIKFVDVGLRWLKNHSWLDENHGDGIIFGASKLYQAEGNMNALAGGELPKDLVDVVNQAGEEAAPFAESYFRGYGPLAGDSSTFLSKF